MADLLFDNVRCPPIRVEVGWPCVPCDVGEADQTKTGKLVGHMLGTALPIRPSISAELGLRLSKDCSEKVEASHGDVGAPRAAHERGNALCCSYTADVHGSTVVS